MISHHHQDIFACSLSTATSARGTASSAIFTASSALGASSAVRTETYANAEVLTGQIIQNLNYIQGNIKLTQKDEAYRKFVDDAKALTEKYQKQVEA